jgi:hypothetical protein
MMILFVAGLGRGSVSAEQPFGLSIRYGLMSSFHVSMGMVFDPESSGGFFKGPVLNGDIGIRGGRLDLGYGYKEKGKFFYGGLSSTVKDRKVFLGLGGVVNVSFLSFALAFYMPVSTGKSSAGETSSQERLADLAVGFSIL